MTSWYSASRAASPAIGTLLEREVGEALEDRALELEPQHIDLDRLQHLGGEGVGEQRPRTLGADTARLEVEERQLLEAADRRAMRALHVVGEDLELRLRVHPRLLR